MKLIQITLIISLFGIFNLLLLANISPKLENISDITQKKINENIKISGQVISQRTFEQSNFQLIHIKDKTGNITVTINNPINTLKNQTLIITGKIVEYNKTLQIQANKITSS